MVLWSLIHLTIAYSSEISFFLILSFPDILPRDYLASNPHIFHMNKYTQLNQNYFE
jgi:hypothetical protein